jgi:hypothetical protein
VGRPLLPAQSAWSSRTGPLTASTALRDLGRLGVEGIAPGSPMRGGSE